MGHQFERGVAHFFGLGFDIIYGAIVFGIEKFLATSNFDVEIGVVEGRI
jgi:hypothetical protein